MSWKSWLGSVAGAVTVALAFGCSAPPAHDSERSVEPPPLVTREPSAVPVEQGASDRDGGNGEAPAPVELPPPGSLLPVPAGFPTEDFNVRLEGDDTQSADALLFNVSRLRAVAQGMELSVTLVQTSVDLAYEGSPWLVGKVKVPSSATEVSFVLELDGFGGFQRGLEAEAVDARSVPMAWTSPMDALRTRGQTIVHLDVARSLSTTRSGLRFLPQLEVEH